MKEVPPVDVISQIPYFDGSYVRSFGNLIYCGIDENYREVYIIGYKGYHGIIRKAQSHICEIFGVREGLYYSNVENLDGMAMHIVEWMCRWRMLKRLGKKLCMSIIRRRYARIVDHVQKVKQKLEEKE